MTTQTQPKPAQVWRDLDLDAGEVPQAGDRKAVYSGSGLKSYCKWEIHDGSFTGGYGGGQIWQRPVTPGQCDCAKLREALIKLRDCDWVITPHDRMDAVRDIARKALDKSAESGTGKSAEEDDWKHKYLNAMAVIKDECETDTNLRDLLRPILGKEGTDHDGYSVVCLEDAVGNIIEQLTDARRKLAEAEKELAQTRTTLQNGLDRDIDDTTTPHLAVVTINALKAAREQPAPTWRSYATPPTEEDADELGRVLARWGDDVCRPEPWKAVRDGAYAFIKWWLPLPKLPPEPRQDADEALGLHEAWQKYEAEAHCNTPLGEFEAGYRAALDFVRKQERI